MTHFVITLLACVALWQTIAALEVQPAPASIGADVPATYFGPPPSSVQKELIGPYQLLKSGTVDTEQGNVQRPKPKNKLLTV